MAPSGGTCPELALFGSSSNIIEPYKREAESQVAAANGQRWDLGTQEHKDLLPWLLRARENPR